jgi:dUTP pyrophosphatase
MDLRIKVTHPDALIPSFAYPGDAGMDLAVVEHVILGPGEAADLATGLRIELPVGYWARITGRSSTLRRRGLLINEGIIDNGYRGDLYIYAKNLNGHDAIINPGDRLAQLILEEVIAPQIKVVDELAPSHRGESGFGSSGAGGAIQRGASPW